MLLSDDPTDEAFSTEYFGPMLSVHVYPDDQYERILDVIDTGSRYALTGAVIADDRQAVLTAQNRLRFAAGNFYVNDKPTGAVVGRQPFGGSRGSGTNDKAGSALNLLRWTSARTIKETFVPATEHTYPHMAVRLMAGVFANTLRPAIMAASRRGRVAPRRRRAAGHPSGGAPIRSRRDDRLRAGWRCRAAGFEPTGQHRLSGRGRLPMPTTPTRPCGPTWT